MTGRPRRRTTSSQAGLALAPPLNGDPIRRGNTRVPEEPLGEVLVHGQSAPDPVTPHEGNPRQIEEGLDGAVLPAPTVEGQEDHVRAGEERVPGEEPEVPGPEEVLRVVRGLGISDTRVQDCRLFRGGKDTSKGVHPHHVVPGLPQGPGHLDPGSQGDLPLLGDSSHEDGDLQGALLLSEAEGAIRSVRSAGFPKRRRASGEGYDPPGGYWSPLVNWTGTLAHTEIRFPFRRAGLYRSWRAPRTAAESKAG